MSPEQAVMLALTTGAAARMGPNNWALIRPEVEAYMELVDLLKRRYAGVNARMMEVAPGSKERQELLSNQIQQAGAANSRAVLRRSRRVLDDVLARTPEAIIASFVDPDMVREALTELDDILEEGQHTTRRAAGAQ